MMACLLAGLMQIPSNSYCCSMSHSMSHCRARFMSHSMSRSLRPVHCAAATISSRTSSFSPAPSAASLPLLLALDLPEFLQREGHAEADPGPVPLAPVHKHLWHLETWWP